MLFEITTAKIPKRNNPDPPLTKVNDAHTKPLNAFSLKSISIPLAHAKKCSWDL